MYARTAKRYTCCDDCTCPGCCPLPTSRGALTMFGADDANPSFSVPDVLDSQTVKIAAAAAATYHGYRRTGSLVWALIYGLAGRFAPVATTAISVAQGYGQKKPCP